MQHCPSIPVTGMLETTRIRREGYSSRPLFADFVHRYKVLGFPCRAEVSPSAGSCRQILEGAGISGFELTRGKPRDPVVRGARLAERREQSRTILTACQNGEAEHLTRPASPGQGSQTLTAVLTCLTDL